MSRLNPIKVISLLLLLIVGFYIYMSIELVEKTVKGAPSIEAHKQPFLAAQRLLAQNDKSVEFHTNYRTLFSQEAESIVPTTADTLILTDSEVELTTETAYEIIDWVGAGGNLILATNSRSPSDGAYRANSLIEYFDIEIQWQEQDENKEVHTQTELISEDDVNLQVNLETAYHILLPEDQEVYYSAGTKSGDTFVQIEFEQGLITLLTDVQIWNNFQIGEYDNVLLLNLLIGSTETIYIFSPVELPHWFSLLYGFAPWFVVIGALLLVLVMWRYSGRIGPIQVAQEKQKSLFKQHIHASAEYYWRNKQQAKLIAPLRRAVLTQLQQKWPSAKHADAQKQVHLLAQLSGWPETNINELLFNQEQLNETQFTKWVSALQELRKML